jgi:hypothetical protein
MLASIPNRKKIITNISKVSNIQGLPNTATLKNSKKQFPKTNYIIEREDLSKFGKSFLFILKFILNVGTK